MNAQFRTALKVAISLKPADLRILLAFDQHGRVTTGALSDLLALNPSYISQRLAILHDQGMITPVIISRTIRNRARRPGWSIVSAAKFDAAMEKLAEGFDTYTITAKVSL